MGTERVNGLEVLILDEAYFKRRRLELHHRAEMEYHRSRVDSLYHNHKLTRVENLQNDYVGGRITFEQFESRLERAIKYDSAVHRRS